MKYLYFFYAISLLSTTICNGVMSYGKIERDIIDTHTTSRFPLFFFSDEQTYTTGGITFVFPTNLFSLAPKINVSLQPTVGHPTTETFVAEVSANSNVSATVMVYNINTSPTVTLNEASNGSVIIYLFAVENPL